MRVFVATPEAPISIELNARVQPAPAPCPTFHPDSDGPIPLSPGHIWVLRLPYLFIAVQINKCFFEQYIFIFNVSLLGIKFISVLLVSVQYLCLMFRLKDINNIQNKILYYSGLSN